MLVKDIANENNIANASTNANKADNHDKAACVADMLKIGELRFRVFVPNRILVEN